MVKPEQVLILDPPSELHFQAPFNEVVTSYLKLTNPTDQRICFKIKTTAPKTYCVRPNYGIILPKKTTTVSLMLQPFDFETAEKGKHKFMVQSIYAREGEEDLEALWNETAPDKYMTTRLICVFDLPPIETVMDGSGDKSKVTSEPVQEEKDQPSGSDSQLLKQLQEKYKEFTAQVVELRQENTALKEESLRSRLSRPTSEESKAPVSQPRPNLKQHSKASPPLYIYVVFILIFLMGIYIGRFV